MALRMSCLLLYERRKGTGEERDNTMFGLLTGDKQMRLEHRKKHGRQSRVSAKRPTEIPARSNPGEQGVWSQLVAVGADSKHVGAA